MQDKFTLPRCESCGKHHYYPRGTCPHCGSARITAAQVSGRGEVYSFSVVHRAPKAEFKDDVPYVVAIVKTDEGPHLMSRVVDIAPEAIKIGMRLRVRLDERLQQPVFTPE